MNPWIDVAGWTLIHFVWQGALIAIAAGTALRILRTSSPHARYAVGCAALAAMLTAPLVTARVLVATASMRFSVTSEPQSKIEFDGNGPVAGTPRFDRMTDFSPVSSAGVVSADDRMTIGVGFERLLPILVGVWIAGVAVLLIRLAGGWRRVRQLHRAALDAEPSRWAAATARIASSLLLHRIIHVVDSPLIDTPTVVGWVRPVIVLPIAVLASLSPSQVDAILAHELAHIRRHDFLANLLQTLAETLLFYHPAVWWVSGRIRVEREHCCDLMAVSVCGDAVGYAEALTELESWRGTGTTLAVAATGGSLLERVRRLLGVPSEDPSPPFAATTIGMVAVLLVLLAGATHFLRAAQPEVDSRLTAEAALANETGTVAWRMVFNHPTGELNMIGFTARELIRFAWQIPNARIIGGPGWLDTETFRVTTNLSAPPGADEMQSIVRQVLEDRFKLATHLETRDLPAYALVMARNDGSLGPNLRPSTRECFDFQEWIAAGSPPRDLRPNAQRQPVCGEEAWDSTLARTSYVAITMPQLAAEMHRFARVSPRFMRGEDRDIVDRTGLPGRFDMDLHALLPAAALMNHYPVFRVLFEPLGIPSMPRALEEQLGLKLEDSTAPYDVIVLDSAERPTINQPRALP